MNIYARKGAKVVFTHPNNGLDGDKQLAAQYLTVGAAYTVLATTVFPWRTEVYLLEFPAVPFNSVMFEDAAAVRQRDELAKGMRQDLRRIGIPHRHLKP